MCRSLVLAACLLVPGTAFANDSSALLEAGGIVLTTSKDVVMESEDLRIGVNKVRVAYVFRNTGSEDVETEVAFPVPEWAEQAETDIQLAKLPNPMKFVLTVDGKPKAFETEIERENGNVRVTHHWAQRFPKGRTVAITHEYVPVTGAFFSDSGRYSEGAFERDMTDLYCSDEKQLGRLTAKERPLRAVHYILTTGANWNGPIGQFKLTITKTSAKDEVSTCFPDLKRATPLTLVATRKHFKPDADLKVLFVPAS